MIEAKHQVKRRIAKTSFAAILLTLAILLACIGFGNENTAKNLSAAAGSIAAILFFLTTIVLAYMGIVHHDSLKGANNG